MVINKQDTQDHRSPTLGELERTLSQGVQRVYREVLAHSTGKITCKLFKGKLAIFIDEALTRTEAVVVEASEDDDSLQRNVHSVLTNSVKPKIIALIEDVLDRKVVDFLKDTAFESRRTAILVVLSD